jgi:hypothetical protein
VSQVQIFELFNKGDEENKSFILVQKFLKSYVALVKELEADIEIDSKWTL